MKSLLALALLSTSAFAQDWTETFKIPEGMTYRVKAAGYDCGTFGPKYVEAPVKMTEQNVTFRQLSADKDLNKFLIEATYPNANGEQCVYGAFFDRKRDGRTLDLTHSLTQGEGCEATQTFLDAQFASSPYEASKRGIRYIAVNVMNESNEVCESGIVRMVFDRRM